MESYNVQITAFIVACVFFGLLFLFIFLHGPVKTYLYSHHTIRMYYKTVRKVAYDGDYYLINKWEYSLDSGKKSGVHINHLLFGDKFIYVIKDAYFHGAVKANADDPSWVNFYTKKKKKYIDNPLIKNKIRADRISIASGLDRNYFVSVTLVNDDCMLTPLENKEGGNFLVPLSHFQKFIEANESRKDVHPFSAEELSIAVRDLDELNQNGK
ncbi:MAG: hypothetical protein MJ239_06450 [Bacilli bacterium]|nr:hypothetical protein [Bacilli bacterium]